MSADPRSALVAEAIDKVHHIKADVVTALCRFPDVPQQGPAAADEALECLARAEQHIQQLQVLGPQLQQLHAAVLQNQPSVATQQPSQNAAAATAAAAVAQDAWTSSAQQQARQAALAMQQQVQAALCSANGSAAAAAGLRYLQPPKPRRQYLYDHGPLLRVIQSVLAAAPKLKLHLFKSSNNQELFVAPPEAGRYSGEANLAKYWGWIDEVRVVCPGVFAASIALAAPACLEPVRVCVDSADKAASIDAWASSKHQVFKRISNLAVRALHHFQQLEAAHALLEAPPSSAAAAAAGQYAHPSSSSSSNSRPAAGVALECLLLWLACYDDLFSRPCDVSGKLVAWEPATAIPLPPVLRPYWLSLEQLHQAASDPAQRKAYHTHLAPWPPAERQAAAAAPIAAANDQRELLMGDGLVQPAAPADDQLLAQLQQAVAY